jgi:LmbE family N-acetylglucosaminyl deacetylase
MVTNLLAAFAHPDDETIFFGGTLAMLAEKGVHIHLLSATRGEGGEVGEPPLCQSSELGRFREQELRCAAAALGARSLTFLNYADPRASDGHMHAFEADLEGLISQIGNVVKRYHAEVLITHGSDGEYGHPGHKFMHNAVIDAAQAKTLCAYTVSATFEDHPRSRLANQNDPADFIVNIEPWFDRKPYAIERNTHSSSAAGPRRRAASFPWRKY